LFHPNPISIQFQYLHAYDLCLYVKPYAYVVFIIHNFDMNEQRFFVLVLRVTVFTISSSGLKLARLIALLFHIVRSEANYLYR
jgi:hypothetical protein